MPLAWPGSGTRPPGQPERSPARLPAGGLHHSAWHGLDRRECEPANGNSHCAPLPLRATVRLMQSVLRLIGFLLAISNAVCAGAASPASPYGGWKNGPPRDDSFFPIAVWLQPPGKARQYLDAGFNTFVGLWKGPTEEQLAELKRAGMRVVCEQNEVARKHLDDSTI